jgi:hypothetical protein
MIELALSGAYRGRPHEMGAWAYALRRGAEQLGRGQGVDRPLAVTSRLAAEAAALALGLEDVARDWAGEEVLVRTASAGLEGLLIRRGRGVAQDLTRWYARVCQAAAELASVRILPASAADLDALRAHVEELLPAARNPVTLARAWEPRAAGKGRG